ncbi:excalibur calcium-binding domain-containing protein [Ruegeria sp.]|uniref:excalibur calcium-binding domain-containing protein n=1 Tax=Ruegeria sp. TaxID=1879320 RepID=UPI00230A15C0|nr:excalibur calcium-binding domain-containing protein [Ruegeria sp.]MDA7967019.1 excalibur calcium-binding domain-containing protein [Ruegeria sp.]
MALPHMAANPSEMTDKDSQSEDKQMTRRNARRHRRADALRRRALSPVRILLMVLALPATTAIIAVGVYLRVTDYERDEAIIHLIALGGCDVVQAMGFGPFRKGDPGYHPRNDPDGNGVTCGSFVQKGTQRAEPVQPAPQRTVGGAKFIRP